MCVCVFFCPTLTLLGIHKSLSLVYCLDEKKDIVPWYGGICRRISPYQLDKRCCCLTFNWEVLSFKVQCYTHFQIFIFRLVVGGLPSHHLKLYRSQKTVYIAARCQPLAKMFDFSSLPLFLLIDQQTNYPIIPLNFRSLFSIPDVRGTAFHEYLSYKVYLSPECNIFSPQL